MVLRNNLFDDKHYLTNINNLTLFIRAHSNCPYLKQRIWAQMLSSINVKYNKFAMHLIVAHNHLVQSAGTVECTDCISAQGYALPPPTRILNMTLNNLIGGSRNS